MTMSAAWQEYLETPEGRPDEPPEGYEWGPDGVLRKKQPPPPPMPAPVRPDIDSWEAMSNIATPTGEQFSTVSGDDIGGPIPPQIFPPSDMRFNPDIPLDASQVIDARQYDSTGWMREHEGDPNAGTGIVRFADDEPGLMERLRRVIEEVASGENVQAEKRPYGDHFDEQDRTWDQMAAGDTPFQQHVTPFQESVEPVLDAGADAAFGQIEFLNRLVENAARAYSNSPKATGTGLASPGEDLTRAAFNLIVPQSPAEILLEATPFGLAGDFSKLGRVNPIDAADAGRLGTRPITQVPEFAPEASRVAGTAGETVIPRSAPIEQAGQLPFGAQVAGATDDVTTKAADLKRQIDELKANNDAGQNQQAINDLNARLKGQRMRDNAAIKAGGEAEKLPSGLTPSPVAVADEVPATAAPESTFSETDEFAGNIRLEKLPDDVRSIVQDFAAKNPDVVETARRGTITHEETVEQARQLVNDLGGDWNKIQRQWKPGDAMNAEEITAIRGALTDSTRKVMDAATLARTADTTQNQLALAEAILEQQRIQSIVHGTTAEAGRTLSALRMNAKEALQNGDVGKMQAILKQAIGTNNQADIAKLTDAIKALDVNDPVKVNDFLRQVNKPDFFDRLYFYWINSILSGPITQSRNIVGNMGTALYAPVQRAAAAGIEQPLAALQGRQAQRFWQESPASVVGIFQGLPEGVRGAIETIRTGISPRAAEKLDLRPAPIGGIAGRVLGMPTTMLGAADEFFSAINYRSTLNAEAVRAARREGLKGTALKNRIADLQHAPTPSMMKRATQGAENLVFRGDPGGIAKAFGHLREQVPGGRYVLPFLSTPANLLKYGLKNSPLGLMDVGAWKKAIDGNPEGADELAGAFLGSVTAASLASLVATGQIDITAAAPIDPAERDRFFREGKLPFSVQIPGVGWVEYKQIPGLDTTFTLVASVVDGVRRGEDIGGIASQSAANIATNMLDKSYMNGIGDFLDVVQDPVRYAERYATRQLSGFVPSSGLSRQSTGYVDQTVRKPEGLWETIQSQTPGFSQNVPARLDAFGEEITRNVPSPVQVSTGGQSPVDAELERLGNEVNFVGSTIGGNKLSREEKDAYQRMAGQMTKLLLERVITNDRYEQLSDEQKAQLIDDAVNDARDPVRDILEIIIESDGYVNGDAEARQDIIDRVVQRWVDRVRSQ